MLWFDFVSSFCIMYNQSFRHHKSPFYQTVYCQNLVRKMDDVNQISFFSVWISIKLLEMNSIFYARSRIIAFRQFYGVICDGPIVSNTHTHKKRCRDSPANWTKEINCFFDSFEKFKIQNINVVSEWIGYFQTKTHWIPIYFWIYVESSWAMSTHPGYHQRHHSYVHVLDKKKIDYIFSFCGHHRTWYSSIIFILYQICYFILLIFMPTSIHVKKLQEMPKMQRRIDHVIHGEPRVWSMDPAFLLFK